jgi:hypothetical protein
MSRFLNKQEAGDARQQLIDAGYTENGADAALKEHQDKYRSTVDNISQNIDTSSAIRLGMEGVGAGLGVYGGIKLGKGIYDRMFRPPEALPETSLGLKAPIEPMMDVSQRPVGRQEPRMVGDLFPADVSTKPTFGPTPENPTVDLKTKINNEPKDMGIVKKGKENTLKNEMADIRKTGINPFEGATELKTGTGKAAFEGLNPEGKMRSTYPSIKDVPQGKAFIPNAQYIDVLRNDLGQPTYTQSFTGRDFPTEYKGSIETGKEINRALGRETRAQLEAKGVPHEQMPKPTPGILERVGGPKGSKVIKVGGVAGALISLSDLAKAENLRQGLGNVAEGLLPMGITPSELASGTLSEKQLNAFKEAQKLGSPYRSVPPPR